MLRLLNIHTSMLVTIIDDNVKEERVFKIL